MQRRNVLAGLCSAALGLTAPRTWAQAYPTKPVRILVGYAAGGANDLLARLVGQFLSERLGQTFVVENRPGAGSNIATEATVRAPADGYTLLLVSAANAINASLYERLPFDFLKDIVPVAGICRVPNAMLVNADFRDRTLAELIADAKANPGRITMASPGNGSPQHLAGELFKMRAGVDLVHVPYRGGAPALGDLLAGQVDLLFASVASALPSLKANKLRALGVTSAARLDALPEVPAISEILPGYEASGWYGLGAPRGTPGEVVQRLNEGVNAALADASIKARLTEFGGLPLPGSASDFGRFLAAETTTLGQTVKFSGAKAD
jgi:tripartite-type tricarboxylate transporter receptor subunit TctC